MDFLYLFSEEDELNGNGTHLKKGPLVSMWLFTYAAMAEDIVIRSDDLLNDSRYFEFVKIVTKKPNDFYFD